MAVLFFFLAINEYEQKRRPWVIGGLIELAMTNHPPAGLNIIFSMFAICLRTGKIREKAAGFAKLAISFAVIVGLLALYNFVRFGNPLESGYSYQINAAGISYAAWNVPGHARTVVEFVEYSEPHMDFSLWTARR